MVDADSKYYIIKDISGNKFEIETHIQSDFNYVNFKNNVMKGDELIITHVRENALLEVKDHYNIYLDINDSTSHFHQTFLIFTCLAVFIFTLILIFFIIDFIQLKKGKLLKNHVIKMNK